MGDFYPIATLEEAGTLVVLQGAGREYEGWLELRGRRREYRALTADDSVVRIPARLAPEFWRPCDGAVWPAALPAPIMPARAGRLVDIRPKQTAAAQMRAAIERQRPIATVEMGGEADADWPWAYAAAGNISRDEAEHRILRALKTGRAPGVVRHITLGVKSNYPVHLMSADAGDYPTGYAEREFEPTRRDLAEWWRVLSWLKVLDVPSQRHKQRRAWSWSTTQRLLVWRSYDPAYSWRQIADETGRSPEWARQLYAEAIEAIWRHANRGGWET